MKLNNNFTVQKGVIPLHVWLMGTVEETKRLVNDACKVGTHYLIVDLDGFVLEYSVVTTTSRDSFKTKPKGGNICPYELMSRDKVSLLYKTNT